PSSRRAWPGGNEGLTVADAPPAHPRRSLRRRLGLAVAILFVLATLGWLVSDYFSFAGRFGRLRPGMTKAEVEESLGPPGDYTSLDVMYTDFVLVGPTIPDQRNVR